MLVDKVAVSDNVNMTMTKGFVAVCKGCNVRIGILSEGKIKLDTEIDRAGNCHRCGCSWVLSIGPDPAVKIQNGGYGKCLGIK